MENNLNSKSWSSLMKSFVNHQLELQVPHINANSVLNLNESFSNLGLESAFGDSADFSGINGGKNLHVSSFLQANTFKFEDSSGRRRREADVVEARVQKVDRVLSLLSSRRNRQNQVYQLSFERQFLYVVRHNPTGLIVYIGRYHQPDNHHHHHDHDHQQ